MFRKADLVLLTKIDLLPHLSIDLDAIADAVARVMPQPQIFAISAKTGAGMEQWMDWLARRAPARAGRPKNGDSARAM